jgi:hypothetical protein
VTVGYSFRDPHINEAIRVWIRDTPKRNEPRLVVIDPAERFPVRNIYATHRLDLLPWLQRRADDHGTLEKALYGSNSDIQAAAVPDPWNVHPESRPSR